MKKSPWILTACGLAAIAAGVGFSQDSLGSFPQNFQRQINRLFNRMENVEERLSVEESRLGKQVAPGLYEVHSRVLWDGGWMLDTTGAGKSWVEYTEFPTPLVYGNNRTVFLAPLTGYGIPEPAPGAVRKVRLFVNYGHQWMCDGTPTVTIGDVEFELPMISGNANDMGTNWSQFRELSEYQHLAHCGITMHLKDYTWAGNHCNYAVGSTRGTVYCVEARFYDEFQVN